MFKFNDEKGQLKCSFCGKSQDQVRKLVAGPGVYICDECIELCTEIVEVPRGVPRSVRCASVTRPAALRPQVQRGQEARPGWPHHQPGARRRHDRRRSPLHRQQRHQARLRAAEGRQGPAAGGQPDRRWCARRRRPRGVDISSP